LKFSNNLYTIIQSNSKGISKAKKQPNTLPKPNRDDLIQQQNDHSSQCQDDHHGNTHPKVMADVQD
tara:strand:+ start:1444 stop:1641 length:198 start_codon:yes stop_codon:yes gene_type:complete